LIRDEAEAAFRQFMPVAEPRLFRALANPIGYLYRLGVVVGD
jgi:hypothetical protein